jgi:hypothetical protein
VCNIPHSVVDVFPLKHSSNWTSQRFGRQQEQVLVAEPHGLLRTHGNLGWHQPELVRDGLQGGGLSRQMVPPISNIVKLRFLSASHQVTITVLKVFYLPRLEPRC